MKFVGNYIDYIKTEWVDYLLSNPGYGRFKEGKKPDSPQELEEFRKITEAGYKTDVVYFHMFTKDNFPYTIEKPPFTEQNFHYWFIKMNPGEFMPMHIDPHTLYQQNSNRYWIALQDWEPGHIMMYENQVITDYVKGDVYVYEDSKALHGACNIGYVPRIILQISTYD